MGNAVSGSSSSSSLGGGSNEEQVSGSGYGHGQGQPNMAMDVENFQGFVPQQISAGSGSMSMGYPQGSYGYGHGQRQGMNMIPDLNMGQPQEGSYQSLPFMFGPSQVPLTPLPRPYGRHNFNQVWIESSTVYEDKEYVEGIPTMFSWYHGGRRVILIGSWDQYIEKRMQRSGKEFSLLKVLPPGSYKYKFLVDGQWMYSPDYPITQDDSGQVFNILELLDYIPEHVENLAYFVTPDSPESSYNNCDFDEEDFKKDPPLVPPQLQISPLNAPVSAADYNGPVPKPPHCVLNHLYIEDKRRRDRSVVGLGSSYRYRDKVVTMVLYKKVPDRNQ